MSIPLPGWPVISALVVGSALIAICLYLTENPLSRWVGIAFFSGMIVVLVCSWLQSCREERRLRQLLDGRAPWTSAEFAAQFRDLPRGPEAAAGVRALLEEHMNRNLAGLRPDDPLTEFRAWIDPVYIDELAVRLDFQPPENYPEYAALVTPLQTVRDLVAAIARKLSAP